MYLILLTLLAACSQLTQAQDSYLPEFVAALEDQAFNDELMSVPASLSRGIGINLVENSTFKLDPELARALGSLVGVTTLPNNRVVLFHRGPIIWTPGFFDGPVFPKKNRKDGPIKIDTIVIIDGTSGRLVTSFGGNKFYVPHGISSDSHGNLWVTDVALHQVFRYPYQSIMSAQLAEGNNRSVSQTLLANLNNKIQPDLVLGEPFVPGNDEQHFCKPTDVAVASSGLAFIADGYCNKRIMLVAPNGQVLDTFGESEDMLTPHSISFLEKDDLVCVADRDRARILCYNAAISSADRINLATKRKLMFAIDYPLGRAFAIEHVGDHVLVLSVHDEMGQAHGATIELANGVVVQDWSPEEWKKSMKMPHDLSVTHSHDLARENTERSVYIVEATAKNMKNSDESEPEKKLFKYKILRS